MRRRAAAGGLAAAVLAGGQGRRMGREKATLRVGGVELARRVADAAATVADPVVLVAPSGHRAHTLGYATIPDPGAGPLAALAAALAALETRHVLVLATDHPDLRPGLLRLLAERRGHGEAVCCRRAGRLEPLVAVHARVPALAAAEARLAAGDRSVTGLLRALRTRVLEEPEWRQADPDGRSFLDLDDPEDLQVWEQHSEAGTRQTPETS